MGESAPQLAGDTSCNFTYDVVLDYVLQTKIQRSSEDYIRRNRTIPEELRRAGLLSSEEDDKLNYHYAAPGVRHFAKSSVDADALFSCMQLGEAQIMTAGAFDVLRNIQEELLRKANQSDEDVRGDWEIEIDKLRGKGGREDRGRAYTVGFTKERQHGLFRSARATVRSPAYACRNAKLVSKIAWAVMRIIRYGLPPKEFGILDQRSYAEVSLTFGHEENTFVSTVQVNFSEAGEKLNELGFVGGLHVDKSDDPARYTVAISLANIPANHHPGRLLLTAHRLYWITAPYTAFIFKAVHPHVSLGHVPSDPRYQQYAPTLPIPTLDPNLFALNRLLLVCYPSELAMRQSGTHIAKTKDGYQIANHGIAAFGTTRRQQEYLAELHMQTKKMQCSLSGEYGQKLLLPSPEAVAEFYRWFNDAGDMEQPRSERIAQVVELFGEEDAEFDRMDEESRAQITERTFDNKKRAGIIHWGKDPHSCPPAPLISYVSDSGEEDTDSEKAAKRKIARKPVDPKASSTANTQKAKQRKAKPVQHLPKALLIRSIKMNADYRDLLQDICSSSAELFSNGQLPGATSRLDMLAGVWESQSPVRREKLIPIRDEGPFMKAIKETLPVAEKASDLSQGAQVLANILCIRALMKGDVWSLEFFQIANSKEELLQKESGHVIESTKKLAALDEYWAKAPGDWAEVTQVGKTIMAGSSRRDRYVQTM